MTKEEAIELITKELTKAVAKFPEWPVDPIHASQVVQEEAGELGQATLQWAYESGNRTSCLNEAIQAGAMAIRFLMHINDYKCQVDNKQVRTNLFSKKETNQ